jgi:hypothetical protein
MGIRIERFDADGQDLINRGIVSDRYDLNAELEGLRETERLNRELESKDTTPTLEDQARRNNLIQDSYSSKLEEGKAF